MSLTKYNSLWIGPRLGAVERACLVSVVRQGHGVRLWCYEVPEGVPRGVEVAAAAEVLPAASVIRHSEGSPSLFSNRFRYELQRRGLGPWIDADVYLLRPIPDREHLFAWEDAEHINGSVLGLPADSPLIPELLALFEEKRIPSWLGKRERLKAWWRRLTTGRTGLSHMPWGSTGPHALTALIKQQKLVGHALPPPTFHPVRWDRADWIVDPDIKLEDVIAAETIGVHLWNEKIRQVKDRPAPAGSFLARMQAESEGVD